MINVSQNLPLSLIARLVFLCRKYTNLLRFFTVKHWLLFIPYGWMILFLFIPLLFIVKMSFMELAVASPPYSNLLSWMAYKLTISLNFNNYLMLITDNLYLVAGLHSLKIAAIASLFCLIIAYPLAYAIVTSQPTIRSLLLLLVIMPSWTSLLIRLYAWIGILKDNGLINNLLSWFKIIKGPISILHTDIAIYIGMVYTYLPFMVLPIYISLKKIDFTLVEAALDLGAKPFKTFVKIILPLTKSGVIAGIMLVFIPAVGEFLIPELLGGSDKLMIGNVLWQEFFNNRDWPMAGALAVTMLLLFLLIMRFFYIFSNQWSEKKQ